MQNISFHIISPPSYSIEFFYLFLIIWKNLFFFKAENFFVKFVGSGTAALLILANFLGQKNRGVWQSPCPAPKNIPIRKFPGVVQFDFNTPLFLTLIAPGFRPRTTSPHAKNNPISPILRPIRQAFRVPFCRLALSPVFSWFYRLLLLLLSLVSPMLFEWMLELGLWLSICPLNRL